MGVEMKRAKTLAAVGRHASTIDGLTAGPLEHARRGLTAIPGIGEWSAAEVAMIALGDADAVSVGDYHLPHQISWAFRRVPRSDDRAMLELLEPYRGQRGRVLRLIQAAGIAPPRFGARGAIVDFRGR